MSEWILPTTKLDDDKYCEGCKILTEVRNNTWACGWYEDNVFVGYDHEAQKHLRPNNCPLLPKP